MISARKAFAYHDRGDLAVVGKMVIWFRGTDATIPVPIAPESAIAATARRGSRSPSAAAARLTSSSVEV